jgi:DMSO/TMAO reductase YedYZ heme-binding membrane subunit
MGGVQWKKLQKWSYVLYATLFIHAMGIQVGSMLNPRGGRGEARPAVEITATTAKPPIRSNPELQGGAGRGGHQQSMGFADIQVGSQTKRYVHIASLLLIFGSYLYLRLRKARLKFSFRSRCFLSTRE